MGYITTISFYNDGADQLEKHPVELAKKLYHASMGIQINRGNDTDSLGNHCNMLILQKPRHADSWTLYLHADNDVLDLYEIKDKNHNSIDKAISMLKTELKRLQSLKKE